MRCGRLESMPSDFEGVSASVGWVVGGHTLRAEELARDVERLAADNNDLLTVKELLGDNAGKTAQKVALAIDDDLSRSAC